MAKWKPLVFEKLLNVWNAFQYLQPFGHIAAVALSETKTQLLDGVNRGVGCHQGRVASGLGERVEVFPLIVFDKLNQQDLLVADVAHNPGNSLLLRERTCTISARPDRKSTRLNSSHGS